MNVLRACMLCMLLACLPGRTVAAEEIWMTFVEGTIDIAPGGTVASYRQNQKLGQDVDALIRRQVEQWRFEQVLEDGKPIPLRAQVNLALQAVPEGDKMSVRISDARFFEISLDAGDSSPAASAGSSMSPPVYPQRALDASVMANVTLILDVSESGEVLTTKVERLDLYAASLIRSGSERRRLAEEFEKASRRVLPNWRLSTRGLDTSGGFARVRVPVLFQLPDRAWGRWYAIVEPAANEASDASVADLGGNGEAASRRIALLTKLSSSGS